MRTLSPQSATKTRDINLKNSIEIFCFRKYQTWTKKCFHEKNENEEKGNCCHFSSTLINPNQHYNSIAHWQRIQQKTERSAEKIVCNLSPETEVRTQASKQKASIKYFNLESIKFRQKN